MHYVMLQPHSLIVILIIGVVSGWLASLIVGGGGLIRDLVTGLLGAVVGSIILHGFGIGLPIHNPIFADIVMSTMGAVVVVVVARIVA